MIARRPSGSRRTLRPLLVVVALAAAVLVALPGVAGAHAVLLQISPQPDAVLDSAPAQVELRFNETVSIAKDAVIVLDPSGEPVAGIESRVEGPSVVADLLELTQDGSYTVGWRIVSADGHPLQGAYLFHLRTRTLVEPLDVGSGGDSTLVDVLRVAGTTVALGGLIALAVGLVRTNRWRARPDRATVWPWNLVAVGTLVVLAAAVLAVGSDVGDSLRVVLDTASGRAALVAWLLALVGVVLGAARAPGVAVAAAVGATTVAIGLGGHALSLPPLALSAPLTVAHVLAAAVWLVALLWLMGVSSKASDAEVDRRSVVRVTPWGVGSVLVLGSTGAVLVLDRVPLDQLTSSTYGRLSMLKLGLLAAAVGLALWNRSRRSVSALTRGVRIEAVVVALALVAGTVLAQVSPPTVDPFGGGPYLDRVAFGEGQVELSVDPGTRGTNEIHVIAFDEDGRLMALEELTLQLTLPEADLGPLEPQMTVIAPGHLTVYTQLPLAGTWQFEVIGRVSRFESIRASFEVDIGA